MFVNNLATVLNQPFSIGAPEYPNAPHIHTHTLKEHVYYSNRARRSSIGAVHNDSCLDI